MAQQSTTEAFNSLVDALQRRQWRRAAAMADPTSLASWHQLQIAGFAKDAEFAATEPSQPLSALMGAVPTERAAVAALIEIYGDTDLADSGFAGMTLRQVAALTPSDILARYFELTVSLREAGDSRPRPKLLGEVTESSDLVHVLYRWEGMGWPRQPQDVALASFKRATKHWQFVLDSTLGPPLSHLTPRPPGTTPPNDQHTAA